MQVWPPEGGTDGQTWSDNDGNFVNQNGTWYKDDGALMGFLSGSRYQSVNTKNTGGTLGYDGKTMLPDSSYDYTYDLMPGKQEDDVNYWKNGESGVMASRFLETTGRDATAVENRTTTIEAMSIVVTTGKAGKGGGRGSNNRTAASDAIGDHTVINERGSTTYKVNPNKNSKGLGFETVKRVIVKELHMLTKRQVLKHLLLTFRRKERFALLYQEQICLKIFRNMIDWLQKWFKEQTDGNWEHEVIIKIETIDNPGWSIEIDLVKSDMIPIEWKLFEVFDDNWLGYKFENNVFYTAGDPNKLELSIRVFKEFIENGSIEEDFIMERMR